ncbi:MULTISPECIES: metallophosphoesterase family protein [Hydrogenophaga]|uniref:Putative metallophosphoesterase protein n=1 Tax=Hydrogenophaga intermedia TaxID=65786 RepID=A0A1L1PWC6_HYDIT|nr:MULTISPECIES: metallophosphoesterase [Hydrogenophaga]TMU73442.1 metallophosphoesterase [Hydrogenophaga intermedia]CDN89575.1 Putative metallophosphoesterase protein [Hydrogenophaga intermedia]
MTVLILHLSDIHIRGDKDPILKQGDRIAACTFAALPEAAAVFIAVTGDIAYSGDQTQYDAARGLFESIRKNIQAEKDLPVHFVMAPGNHDCDFSLSNAPRQLTLDAIREKPEKLDDDVIALGASVQGAYRAFSESFESPGETRVGDQLWTSHRFSVEGVELIFDSLNVSWCSNLHEAPGTLIFPVERYKNRRNDAADYRVVLMHHPLNWFSQTMYHPLRQLVRGLANVVVSGHEHVGGVGEDINAETGHSAYIEGCVLQGHHGLSDSSFNVAIFNLAEGTYQNTRYKWDGVARYLASEEGSWADFRTLPKKVRNEFEISSHFEQLLSDPGGIFGARGAPLALRDLYVYADVHAHQSNDERRVKIPLNTTIFHDSSRLEGGVLLTGEEKSGATSLLYMLFKHFHERGLVPIYLRGAELRTVSEREFDQAVAKAVESQYGLGSSARYAQIPKTKKLLLLDDFDDGPIRHGASRAKLLVMAASRFNRFLLTANDSFDFSGTIRPHTEGKLTDLEEFKLLPFGFAKRAELVKRWLVRTSSDGTLDEGQLLQRCDAAERVLNDVMAKNIVPSLPLYLLTLLQSYESGVQGGFEESGLSEYYDFLLKAGLESAQIPRNQWTGIIEYCAHLAWQLHATENKELSEDELRIFNERYSKEQVRVELSTRIASLVKARVLAQHGDFFRFRYHYIYYYLKGKYLSRKMNDLEVQAYVRKCCAHLYVRENANTVLFLAHHSFEDPLFLRCVVDAVEKPFSAYPAVEFTGRDTVEIRDFVKDLPALTYSGKSPEQARHEANRRRDELDDGSDGLADRKEDLEEDEFVAHLISLFKAVEILGQILKNQIERIPRNQRVDLLSKVMHGPLRAVTAYFNLFTTDQAAVLNELTDVLAKRKEAGTEEERKKMAQQLVAWLLQTSTAGFLLKAIVSTSSDALIDDIRAAAGTIGSPAARLIATGVKLDSPGRLPQREMEKLLDDFGSDFIAVRVLQMLTLRRLYMFKTDERDKQWLASKGVVTLPYQHAVEYKTRNTKLLGNA